MNSNTGEFRGIPEGEKPKPMEIAFELGETIEIKGQPFRVYAVNTKGHTITLQSAKLYSAFRATVLDEAPGVPDKLQAGIVAAQQEQADLQSKPE